MKGINSIHGDGAFSPLPSPPSEMAAAGFSGANMDISAIELQIAEMAQGNMTPEKIGEIRLKAESMYALAKKILQACDQSTIEHIKATGKPLVIGKMLYTVGKKKETKCKDVRETLATLLETFGPERVGECLGSSAWKYGQVRKMLADSGDTTTFDTLFSTEEKDVLNEKGEKVDALQKINLEFVK